MATDTMFPSIDHNQDASIFTQKPRWLLTCLVLLFLLATLIRLKDLRAPGVLVEREYTSAIFARSFFFEDNQEVEPWRETIADITSARQPILEPPLTEFLVSLIYRLLGKEDFLVARYLTSTFWLVGGIFMYLISQKLLPVDGALLATAYYLLVPMGILVSRSFQPDALMMMLFLISLYAILRYFDRPSMARLLLAAGLSGLTLLLRPLVIFALFGAFSALTLYEKRTWRAFFQRPFLVFSLVSLALPVAYYGYGIFIADFLRWKVASSFRPYLFFRIEFWREWLLVGINEISYTAFLAALLGFPLLRKGLAQALVVGLVIGYFFFGLAFTYHIHTHGYYHLQLIPIIALAAAPLAMAVINTLRASSGKFWWLPAGAALFIMLYFGYLQIRESLYKDTFESQAIAAEIGEIVNHSDRTVFVAYHYGLPLTYYGEISGTFWPKGITYWFYRQPEEKEQSVKERIMALGFTPEYYVITNFEEYRNLHRDLRDYLVQSCISLAQTDQYLIYHSCVQ